MNECVVTKLKGVVNNPNLPTFGKSIIEFKGDPNAYGISLLGGHYKVLEGTFYLDAACTQERTVLEGDMDESNAKFYLPAQGTGKIEFNYYDIEKITSGGVNAGTLALKFSDLYKSKKITEYRLPSSATNNYISGSIEDFVEEQCKFREVGTSVNLSLYFSLITFKGTTITYRDSVMIITFGENSVTVENDSHTLMGTYDKATGMWTYA